MSDCKRYARPGLCALLPWGWLRPPTQIGSYDMVRRYLRVWWICRDAPVTCYELTAWLPVCASRGWFAGGVWRRA